MKGKVKMERRVLVGRLVGEMERNTC